MAYVLVILGATMWGLIGLFVNGLSELGFTPLQMVFLRIFTAMLMMFVYVYVKDKRLLKIDWRDSKYFVGTGIFSLALFFWCYFSAIQETSFAVAAILLYTAPVFVTFISAFAFKERLTPRKLLALSITFLGILFIIGIFPQVNIFITLYGFILGIGSGIGYALYSIFGKFALEKYDPLTVILYTFIFASIALIPVSNLGAMGPAFAEGKAWLYTLGIGFIPTMLAYILYTEALRRIESSKAAITATVEPVVACLVGVFVFQEILSVWQVMGIVLVIVAVILVQEKEKLEIEIQYETEQNITKHDKTT